MANNAIMIFDGTPTTVITTTGTIATTVFSVASTNATHTEFDNSSDLWPLATATLSIPDTFSAAPAAGGTIDLYMYKQDIDSTNDELAPSTTVANGAHYVGSFPIAASDVAQYSQITISLAGVQKCKFALYNGTSVTMSFSAGNTVKIEGFTFTPSA